MVSKKENYKIQTHTNTTLKGGHIVGRQRVFQYRTKYGHQTAAGIGRRVVRQNCMNISKDPAAPITRVMMDRAGSS